ncbi:unnamed protein product, partial [Bubo scandiacus]
GVIQQEQFVTGEGLEQQYIMLNSSEETFLAIRWDHQIPEKIRVYARKQSIILWVQ